jgi:hypothetical protein
MQLSEQSEKFCLFVLEIEAQIMRKGLVFASILHGSEKKKLKRKGTPYSFGSGKNKAACSISGKNLCW